MQKSLEEVHGSVDMTLKRKGWKKILAFFGPAYMVSVGYMDPGNWATDIAGGSKYGYSLLWVLLMSNLMALLLQSLSARLGIVAGKDLAQASRVSYPKGVNFGLYILAELAIAACDLAEVLGMAIGLQLLFGMPLIWGVSISVLDTIVLLYLQKLGIRKMEAFIISLVAIIGLSFFMETFFAQPNPSEVVKGLIPSIPDAGALYILIGIIGATVMPHNLYLHSALVQSRKINRDKKSIAQALKYSVLDSGIALNIALLVNASILILAASVFHKNGYFEIVEIQDAHKLLEPLLGTKLAPILFAIALISSGQSSTITGTLAGQIIMEGHLNLRIPPWIRRLITRLLAVIPAFLTVLFLGEGYAGDLLILSQVILSMQLGFAVIPLIHYVSDKRKMGDFAIKPWVKISAWVVATLIVVFNMYLVYQTLIEWMQGDALSWFTKALISLAILGMLVLLGYISFQPVIKERQLKKIATPDGKERALMIEDKKMPSRIAITVDFTPTDDKAISHALLLGNKQTEYILIHITETPMAMVIGNQTGDYERYRDTDMLNNYIKQLSDKGYTASMRLGFGLRAQSIADEVTKSEAELLVMGSHGHQGVMDYLFGETIHSVRHKISVPLLVV